jgi:hypothetical protein
LKGETAVSKAKASEDGEVIASREGKDPLTIYCNKEGGSMADAVAVQTIMAWADQNPDVQEHHWDSPVMDGLRYTMRRGKPE